MEDSGIKKDGHVKACLQCTLKCHSVHRVWSHDSFVACPRCTSDCNLGSNLPYFFKYVTVCMESTYYKPAMEVPYDFARMHLSDAVCHVELEGPSGKLWFVKVKHQPKECSLQQGWKEFAASHAISRGDALLFQLMANGGMKSRFSVKIFKQIPSIASTPHEKGEVHATVITPNLHLINEKEVHAANVNKPNLHFINEERGVHHANVINPNLHLINEERQVHHANVINPNLHLINEKGKVPANVIKPNLHLIAEHGEDHANVSQPNLHLINEERQVHHANVINPILHLINEKGKVNANVLTPNLHLINEKGEVHANVIAPNLHLINEKGVVHANVIGSNLHVKGEARANVIDLTDEEEEVHANVIKPNLDLISGPFIRREAAVKAMAKIANCMLSDDNEKPIQRSAESVGIGTWWRRAQQGMEGLGSPHPMFFKTMFATNVCKAFVLNLPRGFTTKYMPTAPTCFEMTLVVGSASRQRSWLVRCNRNCVGVVVLSTGWINFARRQRLKVWDVCIFELVEQYKFMVRILRAPTTTARNKNLIALHPMPQNRHPSSPVPPLTSGLEIGTNTTAIVKVEHVDIKEELQ